MAERGNHPKGPDLFSTLADREPGPQPPAPSSRYVLQTDLPTAIKQLNDDELERLIAAVLAEQKRRGRKAPAITNRRTAETAGLTLTPSKINAVRAAFKAGVNPTKIARQFGILRTDVQKVLASGRE
jgi:hypothetical protein